MKIQYSWGQIVGSNIALLLHIGVKWGQGGVRPGFVSSKVADNMKKYPVCLIC